MKDRLIEFYRRGKISFIFLSIMVLYFLFITVNGGSTNMETLVRYGALFPPFIIEYGQYYRLVTAIFIHIGISHLLFNSYALYIFGPQIERLMGPKKYIGFFLLTGLGGNLATFFFNFYSISAGASSSLFGLFGAFFYLIRKHGDMVTAQGKKDILSLIGINLLLTFLVPSISITAHLGGFITGYILSYIFIK